MRSMHHAVHVLLLLGISLLPTASNAMLVSIDDPVYGPGSLTRDTDTGLEWLDIQHGGGISYNQMVIELEHGGAFESFRYGTFEDLITLWSHAEINCAMTLRRCSRSYARGEEGQKVIDFVELTGGPTGTDSLLATQTGVLDYGVQNEYGRYHAGSVIQYLLDGPPTTELTLDHFSSYASDDNPQPGHWLVRLSVSVPEPTTLLLLGLGLAGLGFSKRRLH